MKRVDELTKAAENQEKELESDFKRLAEEKRLCEVPLRGHHRRWTRVPSGEARARVGTGAAGQGLRL